jgi:hypothetical protein
MTQPPYYELIQADGDGIISLANAGNIYTTAFGRRIWPGGLIC